MDPNGNIALFCIWLVVAFFVQVVKPGQWRLAKVIFIVLTIAALGGYAIYRHREQTRRAQEEIARRADFESRISLFAAKYNAVRDWQRPFQSKMKVYGAELSPVLVREDGRPILSFALVHDVSTMGGRYFISFKDESYIRPRLRLRLDCATEHAHLAMSNFPFATYAVVAQIDSVDLVDQESHDAGTGGPFFQASGRCIDVMQLSAEEWFSFVAAANGP